MSDIPAADTSAPARWDFTRRLGFRVAFLLAVTLLPLGAVSVLQTSDLAAEAQARSEAALMGETLRAGYSEVRLIETARSTAQILATSILPYITDKEACSQVMKDVAAASRLYTLVAYVPMTGIMECSSVGKVFDFSATPAFQQTIATPEPSIIVSPKARVSNASVLVMTHPVLDQMKRQVGFVSVSVPHLALQAAGAPTATADPMNAALQPIALITFDGQGTVLTSSVGLEEATIRVPADRSLKDLVARGTHTFTTRSVAGFERVFSVATLVKDELFLIASWPVEPRSIFTYFGSNPLLFPAIMWMASLLVAFLATEQLVTRHIRVLAQSIKSFAAGNRMVAEINLKGAPTEIREVGEAYMQMTDSIMRDEAELENTVHQKEVLLREVHHRVKNNLQLIASILNMQMRQARSPEAKVLMKSLQDRVMSLATIHRGLYQTSGLTDVRADELLADIVRQIVNIGVGPGRRYQVVSDFDPIRLTPDQAVPLSLLLTEAMTNAMKYAGSAPGAPARLEVHLKRLGGVDAQLEVINSISHIPHPEGEAFDHGTGLGSQLLAAFAQQVGGTVEKSETENEYRLSVTFELRSLAGGEARMSEAEPASQ